MGLQLAFPYPTAHVAYAEVPHAFPLAIVLFGRVLYQECNLRRKEGSQVIKERLVADVLVLEHDSLLHNYTLLSSLGKTTGFLLPW